MIRPLTLQTFVICVFLPSFPLTPSHLSSCPSESFPFWVSVSFILLLFRDFLMAIFCSCIFRVFHLLLFLFCRFNLRFHQLFLCICVLLFSSILLFLLLLLLVRLISSSLASSLSSFSFVLPLLARLHKGCRREFHTCI